MKFWREILEDGAGGLSSIRLNAVLANVVCLGIFGAVGLVNCVNGFRARSEVKAPDGLGIYAAAVVGLKVYQRSIEEKAKE